MFVSSDGCLQQTNLQAGIQAGTFEDAGFETEEVISLDEFEEKESPGLSGSAIVGIVIGAAVFVLLVLLMVAIIIVLM